LWEANFRDHLKRYPFLDELVRSAETAISNRIRKEKVLALSTNEQGQIIDENKSIEIEILKNQIINILKLELTMFISALSVAMLIRNFWLGLIKSEMMVGTRFFFLTQACQGAFCFGMMKMLRSELGTALVKVWTQERKWLFGRTMFNVICLAILDFTNGVH